MDPRPVLAVDDRDLRIHRKPKLLRRVLGSRYRLDPGSGRPIREFVMLADRSASLGMAVIPASDVPARLKEGVPVLRFGPSDHARDVALLEEFGNEGSEWNVRNLEMVREYASRIDLGRRTWRLFLRDPGHRARLADLFREHGRLFVKSVTKGWAEVSESAAALFDSLGDLALLGEDSLDVLVSEVVEIRRIRASTPDGATGHADEWRHFVWRGRIVASIHAFECDEAGTERSGEEANRAKAEETVAALGRSDFATSYVLDTMTLADGRTAVIETNSFFSSGIYAAAAVDAVAEAIAAA